MCCYPFPQGHPRGGEVANTRACHLASEVSELPEWAEDIVDLFEYLQTQWGYTGGFMSLRVGIPRTEVQIEADARGIALTPLVLDLFRVAEDVIRREDMAKLPETNP